MSPSTKRFGRLSSVANRKPHDKSKPVAKARTKPSKAQKEKASERSVPKDSLGGSEEASFKISPIKRSTGVPEDNASRDQAGHPTYAQWKRILDDYLGGLHKRKRDKALISAALHESIYDVLADPGSTHIGTAQFRFWARKMFTLVKCDDAGTAAVTHDGRPVAVMEYIYEILCMCHAEARHAGRDKTCSVIREYYTWIPKELTAGFVKACPTCTLRRSGNPELISAFEAGLGTSELFLEFDLGLCGSGSSDIGIRPGQSLMDFTLSGGPNDKPVEDEIIESHISSQPQNTQAPLPAATPAPPMEDASASYRLISPSRSRGLEFSDNSDPFKVKTTPMHTGRNCDDVSPELPPLRRLSVATPVSLPPLMRWLSEGADCDEYSNNGQYDDVSRFTCTGAFPSSIPIDPLLLVDHPLLDKYQTPSDYTPTKTRVEIAEPITPRTIPKYDTGTTATTSTHHANALAPLDVFDSHMLADPWGSCSTYQLPPLASSGNVISPTSSSPA